MLNNKVDLELVDIIEKHMFDHHYVQYAATPRGWIKKDPNFYIETFEIHKAKQYLRKKKLEKIDESRE